MAATTPDKLVAVYLRSGDRGGWKLHGVYEDRETAWRAITDIPDRHARVWITEVDRPKPETDPTTDPADEIRTPATFRDRPPTARPPT